MSREPPFGATYAGATLEALKLASTLENNLYKPTVMNPATLVSKGPLRIALDRVSELQSQDGKKGFNIYYELHGNGAKRIVFLMGLNNSYFGCVQSHLSDISWLNQVEDLAKDPAYSVLVLENRGFGNSDAPKERYKTSDMAVDVFEVLKHIGWLEERSVHMVGVSMGGMIALEFARHYPEYLASLLLMSTTAGRDSYSPSLRGPTFMAQNILGAVFNLDTPRTRVKRIVKLLFPQQWIDAPHKNNPALSNGEVIEEVLEWRAEYTLRPTSHGALNQVKACLTHYVSPEALRLISQTVPHIAIYTGDGKCCSISYSHRRSASEYASIGVSIQPYP